MASKFYKPVQVAVRLRPPLKPEEEEGKEPCVRGTSDQALEIWNWRNTDQSLHFDFDAYLDSSASQKTVYERCVKPLLSHALNGQNASVFAYGPTGTGKTFTMSGTVQNPGVIPRSLNHIFQAIDSEKLRTVGTVNGSWTYTVTLSYLEIYQEKIYDLLEPKDHDLAVREDRQRNIFIPKLAEKTVNSFNEFVKLFIPASKNRTTAATKLNSRSSRSHSILRLKIMKEKNDGCQRHTKTGKLYLIDLAGSENNKKTGNKGIRLKESGAINTSLFALGQVVDALNQKLPRIPYRDSKLTRLLQDSLGGSAHACMITNIAPEEKHYMDTYTTLHFAAKSKQVVNRPFTREAKENASSKKRRLDGGGERGKASSAKVQVVELEGRAVPVGSGKQASLTPLRERQANFEVSVHQRLQSLEQNLLKKIRSAKIQVKTQACNKLVSEMQSMRSELKVMTQKSRGSPRKWSTARWPTDPKRASPPRALVAPMPVSELWSSIDTDPEINTGCHKGKKKSTLPHKSKCVQFVKATTEPKCLPIQSPDSKVKLWQLKLDPEFQTKHRNEILKTLNEGSVKQLKSLQSVGEKRAQLIYSWRQAIGPFNNIEDLYKVNGLLSKTVSTILANNLLSSVVPD